MEFQVLWWIHDFLAGLGLAQEHLDYVSLRALGRPEETISSASTSSQRGLRKGHVSNQLPRKSLLQQVCLGEAPRWLCTGEQSRELGGSVEDGEGTASLLRNPQLFSQSLRCHLSEIV